MAEKLPGGLLRSCSGCGAHLLTWDGDSDMVFCAPCWVKYVVPYDEWVASLKPGSKVFVQKYVANPYMDYVIRERDGDNVVISPPGLPEERFWVRTQICHLTQIAVVRR
jgi:hypothetical protein